MIIPVLGEVTYRCTVSTIPCCQMHLTVLLEANVAYAEALRHAFGMRTCLRASKTSAEPSSPDSEIADMILNKHAER